MVKPPVENPAGRHYSTSTDTPWLGLGGEDGHRVEVLSVLVLPEWRQLVTVLSLDHPMESLLLVLVHCTRYCLEI